MECIIGDDIRAEATGQNRDLVAGREFTPPDMGELLDCVLVLDGFKNYPPAGFTIIPVRS
jgi:hypothetical protein